jgi:MFS family permease
VHLALARFLVFFASASVLIVEILAMRLLAPYLGVSLGVFTGVIGVILAGIALGAWMGGRRADSQDPKLLLGPALMLGGVLAMGSPLLVDWIGPGLSSDPGSIVVAATVAFFLPAAALSAVPPLVVKIQLSSLDHTGRVVGSYSAVGTVGAIFGTFLSGFILVAAFPSRPTLVVLGGLLVLFGILISTTRRRWHAGVLAASVFLGAVVILSPGPCQVETAYNCAIVVHDPDRAGGRELILDRLHNSYVDLDDPAHLEYRYIRLMVDLIESAFPEGPIGTVSIGGGGMTIPGYFTHTRPGSVNIALEIDPGVVDLARNEMGLSPLVEVLVEDARLSLRTLESGSAHVVVGDAFSGPSVPWHLTTVEYLAEIDRVLRPDGIYTMNVIDLFGLRFARATAATLLEVFEHVALLVPPSYLDGRSGGNFVFAASNAPLPLGALAVAIEVRGQGESVITGSDLTSFALGAPILRDDFAPVDQMLARR